MPFPKKLVKGGKAFVKFVDKLDNNYDPRTSDADYSNSCSQTGPPLPPKQRSRRASASDHQYHEKTTLRKDPTRQLHYREDSQMAVSTAQQLDSTRNLLRTRSEALRKQDTILEEKEIQIQELQARVDSYRADLEKQNIEVQQLNESFVQLQINNYQHVETVKWPPIEPSAIESRLRSLREAIQDFGRTYSAQRMDETSVDDPQIARAVVGALSEVVRFDRLDPQRCNLKAELRDVNKAAELCLTGLLSHTICRLFFGDPFFFITDELLASLRKIISRQSLQGQNPSVNSQGLMTIYSVAQQVDYPAAHAWRAETLRLLSPVYPFTDKKLEQVRHACSQSREEVCKKAAMNFLKGHAQYLMEHIRTGDQSFKRDRDLVQLFQEVGSFAVQLWTQRTAVKYLGLTGLQAGHQSLDGARMLQAHPLHQLDFPDQISQDGKLIKIVVHPAILGNGTPEGDDFDSCRVWARAVVWQVEANNSNAGV